MNAMTVWLQFMVQRIRNWMLQYCHCNFPIFVVVVAIARLFEVDSKPHTKLNFYVLQWGFGLQWVHGEVIFWQRGKTASFAVFCYDWKTKAGWLPASCHIKWNIIRVCVCKCVRVCVCVCVCLPVYLPWLTDIAGRLLHFDMKQMTSWTLQNIEEHVYGNNF